MRGLALAVLAGLGLRAAAVCAQPPGPHAESAQDWAWAQIKADQLADFETRCGKHLDPKKAEGWDDPCRQVSPQFLVDILTKPALRDQIGAHGVRLNGVRIGGTVDLADTTVKPQVWIDSSRVEGDLQFGDAHWERPLVFEGSTVTGGLYAERMHADSIVLLHNGTAFGGPVDLQGARIGDNLEMSRAVFAQGINANSASVAANMFITSATFGGELNLGPAKIGGNLEMSGTMFAQAVNANSLSVAGSMFMDGQAKFGGPVNLGSAKIGGALEMDNASFEQAVNGNSLSVGGTLFMNNHASFAGAVDLGSAKVGSAVAMDGTTFAGPVDAPVLTVGGGLFMRWGASFKGALTLTGANVGGNLEMTGAAFAGPVKADTLKVAGNLFMNGQAKFADYVNLIGAKIGGNVHLEEATAWRIDLSGAEAQEVLLQGLGWSCQGGKAPVSGQAGPATARTQPVPAHWPFESAWRQVRCDGADPTQLPALFLRNTHFADFQDSPEAWPPVLDLEGFRYDRIGAFGGTGRTDMRRRSPAEWADWLARDQTFSTQPYAQLVTVLAAAGHRDTADAVQLAGRERERAETWKEGRYISWAWLSFLSYIAGYGIGLYTFFVLLWVAGLTVLGADVLWFSERARRRGLLWRLGASLHRLLPVIELSKEFTDFFDNPPPKPDEAPNLSRFQVAYFAGHAIAGWVLGFFLIAAMGGIIQKA